MRTLAHISDLHFGTVPYGKAEQLQAELHRLGVSLTVVSGDLTQRARGNQFVAARKFLDGVPGPILVVPGNHDIPLFDIWRRFVTPLKRYRSAICPELNPCYSDKEMVVLGLNTARSLTWKNGRIGVDQVELLERVFTAAAPSSFKILVTHHPFIPPPEPFEGAVQLVGRAQYALQALQKCKVDLLLSGHLHHGYTGDVRTYYPGSRRSIIVVQAGTALSRRLRLQPNAFNLIRLDGNSIDISVRSWSADHFRESACVRYQLSLENWTRVG